MAPRNVAEESDDTLGAAPVLESVRDCAADAATGTLEETCASIADLRAREAVDRVTFTIDILEDYAEVLSWY